MSDLFERLGPRARSRPAPRFGVTVAGAGCALVVFGTLLVGGDSIADSRGSGEGGGNLPGVLLSAAVTAAGFLVLRAARTGPIATAGVVASALGVPPLVFFLTYSSSGSPPFNLDAILFVAAAAWVVSYFVGPGRGHTFYLGAALIAVWLFVLEQFESVLSFPFLLPEGFITGSFGAAPDPTTTGFVSLMFGVGYLGVARGLDSRDLAGVATPAVFAGVVALYTGVFALAGELDTLGTGAFLLGFGLLLAGAGTLSGRRATAWIGGVSVFFGIAIIVGELGGDSANAFGLGAIVVGLATILTGHLAAERLHEPAEFEPVPMDFAPPSEPPYGPPPGPAH